VTIGEPVTVATGARTNSQENGYLVLRFLAEDFAKELVSVLNTTLRALSSRRTSTGSIVALHVVREHGR